MVTFDTEDDSKGEVKIINFYDGEHHVTFRGKNLQFRAWSHLRRIEPETVWACNCAYDLVNLFGMEWLGKLCTLQYVKAGLMRATYREGKITFYDTVRHWPATVERMGQLIGLPKLEMPHKGCDCDDCVTYCQRDSEITWKYAAAMIERYEELGLYSMRSTLPAMAMQAFRQNFYFKDFPELPDYVIKQLRKGYYGGRVEIYQTDEIRSSEFGKINHYDVNSLFPSVMRDFSYPDLSTLNVHNESPNLDKEGMWEGWISVPQSYFPALPFRDDEILFPYGTLFGSWTYPEVRQCLKDGGEILSTKECIEFDETENPFDKYVEYFYGKRLESKNEVDKEFFKLMLNSLYGKFGSHNEIVMIYDDEEHTLRGVSRTANVIWSAYVTAYARLRLLDFLRSTSRVFYTDTDSLFTPDKLDVSAELGKLKLEGSYDFCHFKGNKLYMLENKARAKGVRKQYAADFFENGIAQFAAPVRYREARKRGLTANVWRMVEKRNQKGYTKRRIVDGGNTEPWEIRDYRRFINA